METAILIICYMASCLIISYIFIQFMDDMYIRKYKSSMVYYGCLTGASLGMTFINYFDIPLLNLILWAGLVALGSVCLFYDDETDRFKMLIESEAIFAVIVFTETVAVVCISGFLRFTGIQIYNPILQKCLEVTVSKVVIIIFYYTAIRYFISDKSLKYDKKQYTAMAAILLFSILNSIMIIEGPYRSMDIAVVAIEMGCSIIVDLYLLSFLKNINVRKQYDEEIKMLNQQAKLQYDYYVQQELKYNNTLKILHDVNRHVKAISDLSAAGNTMETKEYAEQISDTLKPLIPVKYTENAILNILLSDKKEQANEKGIEIVIQVNGVDFGFMDAMDVTTIFGNLLDNAIEACEAVSGRDKLIELYVKNVQEMVSAIIINDGNPLKWKDGMPVSDKGEGRGIGLLNVKRCVEKYDGSISMRENDGKFVTEFFLNT